MPELRLGRLPKAGVARLTIALPEPLKEELDLYATEHSRLYEPVETTVLIPHMLEAFLRSGRGWRSRKAKVGRALNEGRLQPAARCEAVLKMIAPPEAILVLYRKRSTLMLPPFVAALLAHSTELRHPRRPPR
jgi:hypothetical protein